ncbi:hypothetical protein HYW59_00750 [Candidatus Kaiserbacteria bacterium]|nr:hypothetical protein [Candidatus Kaiserbacteria bacterium]
MGQLFSQYKLYALALVGIAVAIGAWWVFSAEPQDDALLATESPMGGGLVDKELVGSLLQLRAVSLGGTIFSDPAFIELQDFGTQIIPEPVGRPNPFAPTSYRGTSTSSGSQLFQRRP